MRPQYPAHMHGRSPPRRGGTAGSPSLVLRAANRPIFDQSPPPAAPSPTTARSSSRVSRPSGPAREVPAPPSARGDGRAERPFTEVWTVAPKDDAALDSTRCSLASAYQIGRSEYQNRPTLMPEEPLFFLRRCEPLLAVDPLVVDPDVVVSKFCFAVIGRARRRSPPSSRPARRRCS